MSFCHNQSNVKIVNYYMPGKIIRFMDLKSMYKQEEIAILIGIKQRTVTLRFILTSKTSPPLLSEADCEYPFGLDKNSGEKVTLNNLNSLEES